VAVAYCRRHPWQTLSRAELSIRPRIIHDNNTANVRRYGKGQKEKRASVRFSNGGFFLEVLSPAEYVEEYVIQPIAERMLAEDAQLKAEFEQKLKADSTFAKNPQERLQWFYQRTPFFDSEWNLYPVAREMK
jgi:hypothetical protein